jgi:hypothetical protein
MSKPPEDSSELTPVFVWSLAPGPRNMAVLK